MANEFPESEHDHEEESEYSEDESNDNEEVNGAEDPSLEELFEGLQDDYDEQEKLLGVARAERDALQVDITQLKRQQTQDSKEIRFFKDQIRRLKEERDRLRSEHSTLSQQSKSQRADLKRLQKENENQDLTLGSLKEQIGRLETEVSKLKNECKPATSNRPRPSIEDVEDESFALRGTEELLGESDPVMVPNPAYIPEDPKAKPVSTTKEDLLLATENPTLVEINQTIRIKQLESLAEEGRARESGLQKQVDDLSAEANSLKAKLEFERKYGPERMDRWSLEKTAKKFEKENSVLVEQIQQKNTESYNQQKLINSLREENWQSECYKELQKQKDDNYLLEEQNKQLQTSLNRQRKKTELALVDLTKKFAFAQQDHEDSKRTLQGQLVEEQEEARIIKGYLRAKTSEVEKCKSEANMLRSQLRAARTEVVKIALERDMATKKMRSMGAIFEHLSTPNSTIFMMHDENRELKLQLAAKDKDLLAANAKIKEATDKANSLAIAQHVRNITKKATTITDGNDDEVTLLHGKLAEAELKLAASEDKLSNLLATAATVREDIASKLSEVQKFDGQNEILLSLNRLPLKEKKKNKKRHRFHKNQIKGFKLRAEAAEAAAADAIVQGGLSQGELTEGDDSDTAEMITPNDGLLHRPVSEHPNTVHADRNILTLSCAETTAFINSLSQKGLELSRDQFTPYLSGIYTGEEDEIKFDIVSQNVGGPENGATTVKMSSLHAFAWGLCFGAVLLYLTSIMYGVSWSFSQGMSQSPSPNLENLPMKPDVIAEFAGDYSFTGVGGFEGVVRHPLIVSVKATEPAFQEVPDIPSYRVSEDQTESYIVGNKHCKSSLTSMNTPGPKSRLDNTPESHSDADTAKTAEVVPTSATLSAIQQVAHTANTFTIAEASISPKPSHNTHTTMVARWKSSISRFGQTVDDNLGIEIAGMFSIFAVFVAWLI